MYGKQIVQHLPLPPDFYFGFCVSVDDFSLDTSSV
jgi:hypothetical protein